MAKSASIFSKSPQELVDKLNSTLPIRITSTDIETYPEFGKLLLVLSNQLTERAVSNETEEELCKAEGDLQQEKRNWWQYRLLHHTLQELIFDWQLKDSSSYEYSEKQYHDAVKSCVTSAEICDYLDCDTSSAGKHTLLGLTKEDILGKNPHRSKFQANANKLVADLGECLKKKCENIVHFYEPSSHIGDSKFTLAKAGQLPSFLESERNKLHQEQKLLKDSKLAKEKQLWQYSQTLLKSLNVLDEILQSHKLKTQSESDTIMCNWLSAKTDALALKIRVVESQLLCDTYTADTIKALDKIGHYVKKEIEKNEEELLRASHALQSYESVGMGFDDLVKEYGYLQEELDKKRWARSEVASNMT
ncbi:HAUS augmin-like complex subunit 4 isoform X2 [Lineus longissimus]|uniref:HAUS augmin-like complex subunit 4 isoform X2 n=1 Tax=Lineus longissimus TaxID=88925 RepID=UPI002B4EB8D7